MKPPKIIALSETVYRKLLRLYPAAHRREYAEQMVQLFRDQCRDAWRAGHSSGVVKFWLRVLPDLGKTSAIERIAALERKSIMKNQKHLPTFLTVLGLGLGLFSFLFTRSPELMVTIISASALCVLAKAVAEMFRPTTEWLAMGVRTFVLLFVYAVFMPAWGKLR